MSSNPTTTFTRFRNLPLELRLMIWDHALSGWSVFASGQCCPEGPHRSENYYLDEEKCSRTNLVAIGSAHHLVGWACRESYQLFKKSFTKIVSSHSRECNLPAVYWANMDTAILYVDMHPAPTDFLYRYYCAYPELPKFQHVALRYGAGGIEPLIMACSFLAAKFRGLQTIILQTYWDIEKMVEMACQGAEDGVSPCSLHFNLARAPSYYSTMLDHESPEPGVIEDWLQEALLRRFPHPRPKLYLRPQSNLRCSA